MKKYLMICLGLLLALTMCMGCGGSSETDGDEFYLYYLKKDSSGLEAITWDDVSESDDIKEKALDALAVLQENPLDVDLSPAIPDSVTITKVRESENGQFFVYFDSMYDQLEAVREVLCRAAIVKTLTQFDEIDFVGFYVNDQPLMDPSTGAMTMMSADSFVDIDSTDYQKVVLTLYYTDETGSKLVETERTVASPKTKSKEQLVMEQLIAGSDVEGAYATLPEDISIISITVKKGTCYLNLSSEFLDNPLNLSEYIPIYSIVNSLTELPTINKVQFSVEGSSNVSFRNSISLATPFERKMDYVDSAD